MTEQEVDRIIAEKVMGWHREWDDGGFGEWYNKINVCMYRSDIHGSQGEPVWNPAKNIAQAIEAARVWLAGLVGPDEPSGACWELFQSIGNETVFAGLSIYPEGPDGSERQYRAVAATEARALSEAWVKAVSDE